MNAVSPRSEHTVVLASHNAGKLAELRSLFDALGRTLIALPERTQLAADETACTFVENALLKARHAAELTGLPSLADDSGLCVHALGGAPGVRSARFAADAAADDDAAAGIDVAGGVDAANNAALLRALRDVDDRRAYFFCVLVYLRAADDPEPLIAAGRWPGVVLRAPRGDGGFGYDPLFLDEALQQTAAELPREVKNARSHRARAARALATLLAERA